jgi:hypothetical protein
MIKLLLGLLLTNTTLSTVSDCSKGLSLFKIEALTLTPDSPVSGQNATLYLKFNNPLPPITDGTVTTKSTYNSIPVETKNEPLCQNTACPVITGSTEQSSTSQWPELPSGTFVTQINWNDLETNSLLCIKITVKN